MWKDVDKLVVNITFFDDFKEQKKRSRQQSSPGLDHVAYAKDYAGGCCNVTANTRPGDHQPGEKSFKMAESHGEKRQLDCSPA